jgi:hypothetical protein
MTDVLAQVIERASIDPTFRAQLQSDPEAALVGYALTVEEKAQLRLGEPAHAEPLGLDVRNTKQGLDPGSGQIEIAMPTSDPFR